MNWNSILGKIQKPLLAWKNAWKEVFENIKVSLLTYLTNFPRDTGYERFFFFCLEFQQFPGCIILSLKLLESSSNHLSFINPSSHIQALSRLRFQIQISLTGTSLGKSLRSSLSNRELPQQWQTSSSLKIQVWHTWRSPWKSTGVRWSGQWYFYASQESSSPR